MKRLWLCLLAPLALSACATVDAGKTFRELDYPLETTLIEADGVEIAVSDQGQGPVTLLFIHGLGSYMPVWARNVEALKGRYRVVALDLPGYGRSSKANYHYSMDFFADAVQAVIEAKELGPVVLVGHSMGGQIAMTHALRHPGRACALALIAPAGLETFNPGEGRWLKAAVTADFIKATPPEAVWRNLAHNFYRMPPEADFMARHRAQIIGGPELDAYAYANSRSVAAMIDGPVYDRLPQLTAPTLVLFGQQDGLIPNPILHGGDTASVADAARRIPNAHLVLVPEAGHMVQFEQPQAVNDALEAFLTGPASATCSHR